MFGHDDKTTDQSTRIDAPIMPGALDDAAASTPPPPTSLPYTPTATPEITSTHPSSTISPSADIIEPTSAPTTTDDTMTTVTPSNENVPTAPTDSYTDKPEGSIDDQTPHTEDASTSTPSNGGLLELKQQALQQLSPLVGELDQTPEENFHTMMMMIQASDDQSLIEKAYAAAEQITDKKAKAQALLDIVNEINYFTHTSTTPN